MTEQVTVKTNVKRLSDPDAIAFAGTVIKGVYVDKVIAAAPPFDEATLQTAVDDLKGAIAAQAQAGGGTVVTAVKKKKRNVLDGLLRKLAHYVQANCNDDVQLVVIELGDVAQSRCDIRNLVLQLVELRHVGRVISVVDMQLAAISFALGNCTVVTKDSDFAAIPGLDHEDWSS